MEAFKTITLEAFETITWNAKPLSYIIRRERLPDKTNFVTPPELNFQVGFVVHPAGAEVARHAHRPLEREITGTSEVLVVQRGRFEIDIYNDLRELVATRALRSGDIVLLVGGGHSLRMMEDTVLLEIKQGPYTGLDEKEYF